MNSKIMAGPADQLVRSKGIKAHEPYLAMLVSFHLIEGCSSTVRSGLAKLAFEVIGCLVANIMVCAYSFYLYLLHFPYTPLFVIYTLPPPR